MINTLTVVMACMTLLEEGGAPPFGKFCIGWLGMGIVMLLGIWIGMAKERKDR